MAGPLHNNRLAMAAAKAWRDTTEPEVTRRAFMAPLGEYSDGTVNWAWPSIIADGVQGFNSLADSAARARENPALMFDEDFVKRAAADSFNAAGLAATGGFASGAVPEGALASNAVRRGVSSRARAHHGTNNDFDAFDPEFMGSRGKTEEDAFFFGTPRLANEYADGEFSIPDARRAQIYQEHLTPDGRLRINDYNRAIKAEMEQTAAGRVIPVDIDTSNFSSKDFGGYRWDSDEGAALRSAIAEAKAQGKSGLVINNMIDATGIGDPQHAVWGRGTVFSATTGEQLFSNPRTAAAVPAGMAASDDDMSNDPFLNYILRQYGGQ